MMECLELSPPVPIKRNTLTEIPDKPATWKRLRNRSGDAKEAIKFETHRQARRGNRENLLTFSLWCCLALGLVAGWCGGPIHKKTKVQLNT